MSKNLKASSREANIWSEISSSPPCAEVPNMKLRLNMLTAGAGSALAFAAVGASEGATLLVALLLFDVREAGKGTKETAASPRGDGAHASPRGDAAGTAPAAAAGPAGIASTSAIESSIAVKVESISSI